MVFWIIFWGIQIACLKDSLSPFIQTFTVFPVLHLIVLFYYLSEIWPVLNFGGRKLPSTARHGLYIVDGKKELR